MALVGQSSIVAVTATVARGSGEKRMGRLKGKKAVVTGAASGIGRASVLRFAQEGASILAVDVAEEGLHETVAMAQAAGGVAEAQVADGGSETDVAGVVEQCVTKFGRLDVFYANAGIGGPMKPFWEMTADEWEPVVRVNLIGPFLAIKYASLAMRDTGGGSIICTASVAGLRSGAGPTPYSATKAGVISLVQTTASQLTGMGIRVNAICPGLIETGMTQPMFDMARAVGKGDRIGQLNPLQRAGEPVEMANVALFLASDEASYVNGQAYAADAGLSCSHPFVPGRMA
jgi:NAD(P)-dependent dehydrogenase (short-subunit alcohol dehydrogenase family)